MANLLLVTANFLPVTGYHQMATDFLPVTGYPQMAKGHHPMARDFQRPHRLYPLSQNLRCFPLPS